MLGLYYLISMPASVRQHLKETMPQQNFEARYQMMFTLAFLPGVFLPFFTGAIVDQIGSRICLFVLACVCLLGQIIAAVGVQQQNWAEILVGRLIYGIGFESLFVANEAFLSEIFLESGSLGMARGVSTAASYVGYLLCPIISPAVANATPFAFATAGLSSLPYHQSSCGKCKRCSIFILGRCNRIRLLCCCWNSYATSGSFDKCATFTTRARTRGFYNF